MRGTKPHLVIDNEAVSTSPPAPAWLSKDAKLEWKRVIPVLVKRRILTTGDLGSLENYCTAMGQVRRAECHLQTYGDLIDVEGTLKRNPSVGIQADAMTRARLLGAELGLTPVSRSRPAIREDGDDDDLNPLDIS
jgi:P27 family predicted phage terminase small subunit